MSFASEQGTKESERDSPDIEPRMFQFLDAMPVGVFIGLPGGRPYYANAEGMQLLLQDVNPSAEVLEAAKAYRACLAGTDDPYPTEREPMARALGGVGELPGDFIGVEHRRPAAHVGRGTQREVVHALAIHVEAAESLIVHESSSAVPYISSAAL